MENFANKLCSVILGSQIEPVWRRLKQNSVLKGLKGIKKINRSSNYDSIAPSESGRTAASKSSKPEQAYESRTSNASGLASQYSTIKPLENLYTSVKIINGQKHNLEQEKHHRNRQKLQSTEQAVDNERFLEKWMTCGSKEIIMVENYPQSGLAYKGIDSYGEEALKVIDENPYEPFQEKQTRKKGRNTNNHMEYRKESLTNSVTYLLPEYEERAIELFDQLLKCEGLKHTEHPYYYHAAQLINYLMKDPSEELKEQLFFQLIKQQSSGKLIYLKLMALACCFVRPSLRMYAPLLHYLKSKFFSHPLYKEYYSFSFFNLIKNFDTPRIHGCTIYQAHLLMHMRKIPVQFDLPTPKTFFVDSHTTVREFFDEAIDFYGLDEKLDYLLYYRSALIKEGVLLDCLTRVDMTQDLFECYERFTGYKVLMVLKNMRRIRTSNKSFNLMYHYFVQQHLRNYYYLGKDDNIRVAALKLYSQLEDQQTATIDINNLLPRSFLGRYVHKAVDAKSAQLEVMRKVVASYDQISTMTKLEARKAVLAIIKKRQNFMTHFIRARLYYNDDPDDYEIVVGIKPTKLLLIDYESGRYLRKISYERIRRWGKTNTEFCLVLDVVGKIHIETPDARLIAEIFEEYVADLLRMSNP